MLSPYRNLTSGNLFPTQKCVIGDPRSKAPLESAFYARKYDDIALQGHVDEGSGIAWCVSDNYMVMDVDYPTPERPNKQGGESLERLQRDLGINLDDVPQVHSPTGGRHYYFKRPPGLKLRKMLKEYPGIEFITGRNYVLIAGSPHWQGGHYTFDADTELLGLHPTDCPTELLDLLVKVPKPGEHKHIEPEDLEKLLSYLEPDDYSEYDDWLELAMASHSATGGAGLAEFTSWSAGGSKFSSECRVKEQWDSFDAAEEGGITLSTLLYRVKESVVSKSDTIQEEAMTDIARIRAVNEFDDLDFEDDPDVESGEPVAAKDKPKPTDDGPVAIKIDPFNEELNIKRIRRDLHRIPGLFKRGDELVNVFERKRLKSESIEAHYMRIRPVNPVTLRVQMSGQFYLFHTKENKEGVIEDIREKVSQGMATAVHVDPNWPTVPEITSIATSPTLLPDGDIIQEPGLHRESGIYYHPMGTYPPVPEDVSQDEARAAAQRLLDIVVDFPFKGDAHKSAWLSLLLTMLARPAIDGPCPLFVVDGNVKGAGKSLLVSCATMVGTGSPANARSRPKSDEEMSKQITGSLRSGESVACWDNLNNGGAFGYPSLDALLTTRVWSDRILGESRIERFVNNTVFCATANNFRLDASVDTSRRMIFIGIDSHYDDPTERTEFVHGSGDQLLRWVTSNRPTFVIDALKMLRGFVQSGDQEKVISGVKPFASYDAWSRIVRGAILWAGLPDPCLAIKDAGAAVCESTSTAGLLIRAVQEACDFLTADRGSRVTKVLAAEILTAASECDPGKYPSLRRAYEDIFQVDRHGKRINASSFAAGRKLKSFCRQPVNGARLESDETNLGGVYWVESQDDV